MLTHTVYSYEDFLTDMSYLFPIAENFCNWKQMNVPLNKNSTVATIKKLFKNDNDKYAYNLWCEFPEEFVDKIMYHYWSDDPFNTSYIDINTLQSLSFPVKQYIAISLTNMYNRHDENYLFYDLKTIKFNSLKELIELFEYMSKLQFVDHTEIITKILGNDIVTNIKSKKNKTINDETKLMYELQEKENKLKKELENCVIEQKLIENGLSKPTMSVQDIAHGLKIMTDQCNCMCLQELKIRQEFSKREEDLIKKFLLNEKDIGEACQSKMFENSVVRSYLTEHENLIVERKTQIKEIYKGLKPFNTELKKLNRESLCRNEYDKLFFGKISDLFSESLQNMQDCFSKLVLVDDEQTVESV